MPLQGEEETTITLSIGGVEFCLSASNSGGSNADDNDTTMFLSKISSDEMIINLKNFVGKLHIKKKESSASFHANANKKKATKKTAGKKRVAASSPSAASASASAAKTTPDQSQKRKRTNYANNDTMKKAVEEWDKIKNQPNAPSRGEFAAQYGLNSRTFFHYSCDDLSKRRKIGGQPGNNSIVSDETMEQLVQQLGGGDYNYLANLEIATVMNALMELQPELKREQARNFAKRTWRAKIGRFLAGQNNNTTTTAMEYDDDHQSHFGGCMAELPTDPHLDMV